MNQNAKCGLIFCENKANYLCSKCKYVRYCSRDHQLEDWSAHKISCKIQIKDLKKNSSICNVSKSTNPGPGIDCDNNSSTIENDVRICRCMFCGEELKLESEGEAINHMRVCTALQEQFAGEGQFTIPSILRNKIPDPKDFEK